jgi:hypothetical protein
MPSDDELVVQCPAHDLGTAGGEGAKSLPALRARKKNAASVGAAFDRR